MAQSENVRLAAQSGQSSRSSACSPALGDPSVVRQIEQYCAALEAGRNPDRQELICQHPQIADELAACLHGLEAVYQFGLQFREHAADAAGDTASSADLPRVGMLGDFRILREVGRGGMGVVYEAEQVSLGRRVALKVLPFAAVLDPKQLQRFKNEAQAAASLDHPNIVHVYSVGCERAVHFYAMQYIEGQTLAEVIGQLSGVRDQGSAARSDGVTGRRGDKVTTASATDSPPHPVTPSPPHAPDTSPLAALSTEGSTRDPEFFRTVARLGVQAAEALEHAHGMGVVHRDIKPSNLMVESRLPSPASGRGAGGEGRGGEGPHLWITDFGLAMTQTETNLTMTGDLLGTLRYMSPEQVQAKHGVLDHRTDVYSLGLTLYELLTLQPAFGGDDRQKLLRQVIEGDPRPPRQLNSTIPKDLETIVLKATAKEPQSRYATSQQLVDDLRRFLEDRPILAKRPTLVQRAAKWSRRHRWGVTTAIIAVLAALFVGLGLVWHGQQREAEQRRQAEEARRRAEENLRTAMKAVDEIYLQYADDNYLHFAVDGRPRRGQITPEGEKLLKKAMEFYRLFAETNRGEPSVRYETAMAQFRIGAIQERLGLSNEAERAYCQAIEIAEELISEFPNEPGYLECLVEAYMRRGAYYSNFVRRGVYYSDYGGPSRFSQALADFNRAIQLNPKYARAYRKRAKLYVMMGEFDKALASFDELIRLDPKCAAAYLYRAGICFGEGELELAITDCSKAIELHPEDAPAYGLRSLSYMRKAELDKAMDDCNQVIRLAPRESQSYFVRALVFEKNGEFDKAIADFTRAIQCDPKRAVPYNDRGRVYQKMGEFDKAIDDHTKAIGLNPTWAHAYQRRGKAYLEKGALQQAIQDLDEAIRAWPEFPSAYCHRALARARLGQIESALDDTRKAAEIEPIWTDDRDVVWLLATSPDSRLRRPQRAVELATDWVERAPKLGCAWATLGIAQYRAGNWKAAIEALQKPTEVKYYRPAASSFFLAMAHWQLGEKDEARQSYEKAVEWMEENRPWDEELRRFRTEAEELLEIENEQPE